MLFNWRMVQSVSETPGRSRLTHLHEQGWSLSELMRVSGHKSLAALQEYLGVDQSAVDEKLAALDAGFEVA